MRKGRVIYSELVITVICFIAEPPRQAEEWGSLGGKRGGFGCALMGAWGLGKLEEGYLGVGCLCDWVGGHI